MVAEDARTSEDNADPVKELTGISTRCPCRAPCSDGLHQRSGSSCAAAPARDTPPVNDDDNPPPATGSPDAPVSRRELERALRGLVLSDLDTRDTLLQLAARVVALTD